MDKELLEELGTLDLFKDLNPRHLKKIVPLVEVRDVREGEAVIREGRHTGEFIVILEGSAEISVRGKKRDTVGHGEFIGELALMHEAHSAMVTALEPMRLAVIDAGEFRDLLEKEPTVAVHMLEALILRLEAIVRRPTGARS